jgi:hypothetical protein
MNSRRAIDPATMKSIFTGILLIVMAAALAGSLWRLHEKESELRSVRRELAASRPQRPASAAALPPAPAADRAPPRPGPGRAARLQAEAEAAFARLTADERAGFLRAWRAELDRRRQAEAAARELAERNKGPEASSYAGGKATGPPDADDQGGDSHNAWCAAPRSSNTEWLKLTYARPVEISEIAIHETYATGALSRVLAVLPDGREHVLWEGQEPVEKPPVQRIVQVPPGIRGDQIRLELDTTRTQNWQEIDAVELIGRDGSRQWASQAEGSSYWGSGRGLTHHDGFSTDTALPWDSAFEGSR